MEKAKLRTIFAAFAVMLSDWEHLIRQVFFLKPEKENLVIAGKWEYEPEILMNMYKLLIEENSDMTVTVKPNFGKTDFLYEALKKGDIDIYPEFTGMTDKLTFAPAPKVDNDSKEVFEVARDGIKKQDNLALLKPMAYQNTYAVAVPKSISKSIISRRFLISKSSGQAQRLEFNDREDGNKRTSISLWTNS